MALQTTGSTSRRERLNTVIIGVVLVTMALHVAFLALNWTTIMEAPVAYPDPGGPAPFDSNEARLYVLGLLVPLWTWLLIAIGFLGLHLAATPWTPPRLRVAFAGVTLIEAILIASLVWYSWKTSRPHVADPFLQWLASACFVVGGLLGLVLALGGLARGFWLILEPTVRRDRPCGAAALAAIALCVHGLWFAMWMFFD